MLMMKKEHIFCNDCDTVQDNEIVHVAYNQSSKQYIICVHKRLDYH